MSAPKRVRYITAEEYLEMESHASVRHEYVNGRLFAMTGASRRHNLIALNLYSALRSHLEGGKCRAYVSDVKVRVDLANSFYYPDVMVDCELGNDEDSLLTKPVFIAEVLSKGTAAIDRREKVLAYRLLVPLREYAIVYQTSRKVEVHRKNSDGEWELFQFGAGDELRLEGIPGGPLNIPVDAIYKDIDFPKAGKLTVSEGAELEWGEEDTEW